MLGTPGMLLDLDAGELTLYRGALEGRLMAFDAGTLNWLGLESKLNFERLD